MKACPYCGTQYAEDLVACPLDSYPLENQVESQSEWSGLATPSGCWRR